MSNLGLVLPAGAPMTVRAAGRLSAGDPVQVAGPGTVERADAGSANFIGVASANCMTGDLLVVLAGGAVFETIADGDITAGDLVGSGDGGTVTIAGPRPARPRPPAARARARAPRPAVAIWEAPRTDAKPPAAVARGIAPDPVMPEHITARPPAAAAWGSPRTRRWLTG